MPKNYKKMNMCRMCKKRYEVRSDSKFKFRANYYCDVCCNKYFKHEKDKN